MDVNGDVEKGDSWGVDSMKEPFIRNEKIASYEENSARRNDGESIGMVLFSTFVAVCGSFEFGSCVGYSAPTQSSIRKDLDLSLPQGAVPLDIGRLLTGFGIGIFSYVIPVFIAELAPKNIRGGLATLNQLMIVAGSSVAFLIGTVVTWRTLALTGRICLADQRELKIFFREGIVPCLVLLLGLFFIPESPRWLAKVGRQKEFEIALQKLRGKDTDVSFEAAEIQDYIESLNNSPKSVFTAFKFAAAPSNITTRVLMAFQIGIGLMVFQQFGGINGISFYASQTFESAGASSGKIGTIAYACVQVPITLLGAFLMDKSGRRALLMVSYCIFCSDGHNHGSKQSNKKMLLLIGFCKWNISGMSSNRTFILSQGSCHVPPMGPLFSHCRSIDQFYIGSFSIGMGATPWVIMSEIFPINVKGVAGSFVTLVNWIGAWVVSYTFNFLMSWSSSGTFFLYSGVSLLNANVGKGIDVEEH
ncbi:hypothetical protein Sjap_007660 [Stephania japonica]|uniref:Major facilitator superfamily (MFS) profile domain-containing protein n=1 Tax=Stephania japonica TaxID=461633 RepID=A0AAP0PDR2_9MAGN